MKYKITLPCVKCERRNSKGELEFQRAVQLEKEITLYFICDNCGTEYTNEKERKL